jgi:hypothetical protein
VKIVLHVITGDEDQFNVCEIGGGPNAADANQQARRRKMRSTREVLTFHAQNMALHSEIEELKMQQSLDAQIINKLFL